MKYRVSLLALSLLTLSTTSPATAQASQTLSITASHSSNAIYSDAELDSLLAPIALYPDTLLTHILIASTAPLEVVAAHRWQQTNRHLSAQQIEQALQHQPWDPSVKALVPFTDVLGLMANDLTWLGELGNAVAADQVRVLDRVQSLRQYAHRQGQLHSNNYIEVSRSHQIIAIVPRHHSLVYVPFYDTRHVFGHWHHPVQPVYWHYPAYSRRHAGVHWSIGVHLSSGFYFGGIHWQDRYLSVSREPVRRWHPSHHRVRSQGFDRWQPGYRHRGSRKHVVSREHKSVVRYDGRHHGGNPHSRSHETVRDLSKRIERATHNQRPAELSSPRQPKSVRRHNEVKLATPQITENARNADKQMTVKRQKSHAVHRHQARTHQKDKARMPRQKHQREL